MQSDQLKPLIKTGLALTLPKITNKKALLANIKQLANLTNTDDLNYVHMNFDNAGAILHETEHDDQVEAIDLAYEQAYLMLFANPQWETFTLTPFDISRLNPQTINTIANEKLIDKYGVGNQPIVVMRGLNMNMLQPNQGMLEMYTINADHPEIKTLNQYVDSLTK